MLEFRKPNVKSTITSENFSSIEIEPLARGYGLTIGNAIRRVLLSSIPGTAVTKIKLEDNNGLILHEFSSMQGVKEDVCEIILNIKDDQCRFRILLSLNMAENSVFFTIANLRDFQ